MAIHHWKFKRGEKVMLRSRLQSNLPGHRRHKLFILFFALFVCALSVTSASAQQLIVPVTDKLPSPEAQTAAEEEEDFLKPSRPGVANPAEIHKPGVLQVEIGYDANFRAEEFDAEQTLPITLRYAATNRLLFELNFDAVKSETDVDGTRMTGVGDTRLGLQVVALKDTEKHPALAFAYYAKLPSASRNKGLGTGRFDHKIVYLMSKKLGAVDVDFNTAYLIVGREDASGWITGGQAAISFSGEFKNGFGLIGELSGQSKDDIQPTGIFLLGGMTYKANRRLIFDAGLRVGLNQDAPRIGVFTGLTFGLGK
jgi:hypothetical protein